MTHQPTMSDHYVLLLSSEEDGYKRGALIRLATDGSHITIEYVAQEVATGELHRNLHNPVPLPLMFLLDTIEQLADQMGLDKEKAARLAVGVLQ